MEFVDFDRYREWLREQGHDDEALFAKIEDLVALTCLAALEPMRERSRVVGADTRGCYELMGIDCLVDENFKPWVLECNLSPSLEVCAGPESGGDIEEGIKGSLIADMVDMLGLNRDAVDDAAGSMVERLVRETQNEMARSGGFKCLIPGADPAAYLPFMALPRLSDWVVAQALSDRPLRQPRLERWVAEDTLSEDRVYLYDTRLGHLSSLNETASLIWLMATEGAGPDDIASALVDSASRSMPTAPDAWAIRNDVWNTLGDWVNNRFLIQSEGQPGEFSGPVAEEAQTETPSLSMVLGCGRFQTRFFADSAPLINRIADLFKPMSGAGVQGDAALSRLEIVRDTPGFTLILDGKVERPRLPLSDVTQALAACLASHAAGKGDIAIDAGLVASPCGGDQSFLVSNSDPALRDALALALADRWGVDKGRGALLRPGKVSTLQSLGLPLQRAPGKNDELVPASDAAGGATRRVTTVLIPIEEPLSTENGVQPLGVNDALKYLIASCCGEEGKPLDAAGFTRLSEWLAACACYRVDMNNLAVAAAALSSERSVAEMQKASGGR